MMVKRIRLILVLLLLLFLSLGTSQGAQVKNVILLIPDGMTLDGITLARWYQGGHPLAMDEIISGLIRTYSADAPIADSAPAATAFATGYKSHTGYIGVLPDEVTMPGLQPMDKKDAKRPVATVLEAAKLKGLSTGLVATCEIPHATPAGFSAHYPDRKNYDDILEQQVYQNIDVVLGGGAKFLTAEARKDREDLVSEIKKLGYEYVTTPQDLSKAAKRAKKIWGAFASKDLAYDFDRDPSKEPSLAEMTEAAIEVLSKNDKGFFLMVEGSKIDWAAHANDPIGLISDILAFDRAVKVSLDFAKINKQTVVIVAPDHGTGGITIGNLASNDNYDKLTLEDIINPLKKAKLTGEGVEKKLDSARTNIREVMATYYGITDLTEEELIAIKEAKAGTLNYVIGPMISKRAYIGWTTHGHTGEDVILGVYVPEGVERLSGVVENTDIAKYIENLLGLNLEEATQKLLVNVKDAFPKEVSAQLEEVSPNNFALVVKTKENIRMELPINKNIIKFGDITITMKGVTVYNRTDVFVPKEAIEMFHEINYYR